MKFSLWTCRRRMIGWIFSAFTLGSGDGRRRSSTWEALAAASQDFSGAEIEEAINSALYDAFYASEALATDHVFAGAGPNGAAGQNDGRANQPVAELGGRAGAGRERAAGRQDGRRAGEDGVVRGRGSAGETPTHAGETPALPGGGEGKGGKSRDEIQGARSNLI